jgi:Bacterial extracellular solute-binding proteins, family 3
MRLMDVRSDLAPTGMLRASINLGNPVLAQGTAAAPSGVTVDIARELGARVGVPVALVCFDAARESFEAINQGRADICFLAIDPAREETVAFTPPYAVIEGIFAVAEDSPIASTLDVDRPGVRIGVKKGSAYDLYLSRTLTHASASRWKRSLPPTPAFGYSSRGSWRSSRPWASTGPVAMTLSASCMRSSRSSKPAGSSLRRYAAPVAVT